MTTVPAIVIEGTFDNWPGGPQTLTSLPPNREQGRAVFWFGTSAEQAGNEVWFRITGEAIERMPEETPSARGNCLVDALLAWLSEDPDRELEEFDEFQVLVSNDGDTRIEPYGA